MNRANCASHRLLLRHSPLPVILLVLICGNIALGQTTQEKAETIRQLAAEAEHDLQAQKFLEAVDTYRRLLALDPENANAHSNLGLAYYLKRDYAHAAPEFESALRTQPELWNIVALCGISEAQLGHNEPAVTHLMGAFSQVREPSLRMAAGRQLFTILMQRGEFTRAAAVVAELRLLDPKNPDVLYAAHQVYSLQANEAFVALSQAAPESARMYELHGDEMAQVANAAGAITSYRRAIALDPHLSGAHFALGEALSASHSSNDQAQAESEYKQALVDNPSDERALSRLGHIELRRANLQVATADFHRALELQPDDPEANEGLGVALMSTGSSAEAVPYLERAVEADPYDDSACYHLSLACRDAGDATCAADAMKRFRQLKEKRENLQRIFLDIRNASTKPEKEGSSASSKVEK
jgi:tetratricopeptide (TPR) repeat protein